MYLCFCLQQICVEMESLQPVDANEIFMPLNPRDEMARPLEGVVLSIRWVQSNLIQTVFITPDLHQLVELQLQQW